jgi:hypothetical protein
MMPDLEIYYTVDTADWDFKEAADGATEPDTSSIDPRTIKSILYPSLSMAIKKAKEYLTHRQQDRDDIKWLAYITINRHSVEMVKQLL